MDLLTLGKIMLRRWPYVVGVLVLAAATVFGLIQRSTPTYEAQASMILLVPSDPEGSNVNPYAELTKPLATTASALALALNGPETRERIQALDSYAGFSVEAAADSPILGITVESSESADDALRALDLVVAEVSGELARWQTNVGVAEAQQFQADVLTRDNVATELTGARDRMVAGVLFIGLIAAAGAAVMAENVARGRSKAVPEVQPLSTSARPVFFAGTSPDASNADVDQPLRPPATPPWVAQGEARSEVETPSGRSMAGNDRGEARSGEAVPMSVPPAGLG